MKEYKNLNKKETRTCCYNRFHSTQLKSVEDNRPEVFAPFQKPIPSSGICQNKDDISYFNSIMYIQKIGKNEFLSILRHSVAEVGDILLSQINQSTKDCPYIRKWFSYYSQRSIDDIAQAISKFAPLTQVASSFNEYVKCLISRVGIGLQKHIDTGTVEDITDEIKTGKERPGIFEHIKERVNPIMQLSKCADIDKADEMYITLSSLMCWDAVGYYITRDKKNEDNHNFKDIILSTATTVVTNSLQIPSGYVIGFFY